MVFRLVRVRINRIRINGVRITEGSTVSYAHNVTFTLLVKVNLQNISCVVFVVVFFWGGGGHFVILSKTTLCAYMVQCMYIYVTVLGERDQLRKIKNVQ